MDINYFSKIVWYVKHNEIVVCWVSALIIVFMIKLMIKSWHAILHFKYIVYFSTRFSRRNSIVVSTSRCGRDNPGSNPGCGSFFYKWFFFQNPEWKVKNFHFMSSKNILCSKYDTCVKKIQAGEWFSQNLVLIHKFLMRYMYVNALSD